MMTYEEALERVLAVGKGAAVSGERVSVDAACGRVLAEDVASPLDLPPFDYSAMDGYAVARETFDGAGPWSFPVAGESRTGGVPPPLACGAACRIFTGAPIPDGADAVVMQERVRREGERVTFDAAPRAGQNIRRRGEDLAHGGLAVARGTRLRPAHLALVASCDRAWIEVARRPVVTILATGDELRPPGSAARAGVVPESNGVALRAMAEHAGAIARVAPIAADERDATTRAVRDALDGCDVLVTVGGVSVGDHDWVRPALEASGVTLDFWKVAIKPGKPIVLGTRGKTVALGLPGNPASALITFALFGVPLLRAVQGDRTPVAPRWRARCGRDLTREAGRMEFLRAELSRGEEGDLWATPISNQASGAVTGLARADALLCVPADVAQVARGEPCDVLVLRELGA